jgi:hypothetical protein
MFVDPKFFVYALGMAGEKLQNPSETSESRVVVWNFDEICLSIVNHNIRCCYRSSSGCLDYNVFFVIFTFFRVRVESESSSFILSLFMQENFLPQGIRVSHKVI